MRISRSRELAHVTLDEAGYALVLNLPRIVEQQVPYVFEGTAYEIWRRIDGTRTLEQIAAELAGQTGADPGIVAADTTAFVSQLLELGLVTYLEPGAAEQ